MLSVQLFKGSQKRYHLPGGRGKRKASYFLYRKCCPQEEEYVTGHQQLKLEKDPYAANAQL